ncbi:MAG: hypothetical protein ACRDNF_22350 [Streptosporangiaceae bacterium]
MRRARRLRHTAPLTPGTDMRHPRQPATRRRRDAPHDGQPTPPTGAEAEPSPRMPVLGPRRRRPARRTAPPEAGSHYGSATDITRQENRA